MINLEEIQRETWKADIEGRNVHDHLKGHSISQLRAMTQRDRLPFDVMTMSLTGDANIGGIVRSSVLHGAGKVWIFGRRKFDRRPTVGSLNYIDHEVVGGLIEGTDEFDMKKFNGIISKNSYFPVFIEQGGVELQNFDWKIPDHFRLLIVMGNETNGIPESFLEKYKDFSKVVSIPQRGVIRSFNVANAMNIVTWDLLVKRGWV